VHQPHRLHEPSSLTSIGSYAFANCFTLASVSPFPASVTNIGIGTFAACPVGAFSVDPANAFYFAEGGVLFQKNPFVLVQYPGGQPGAYSIPDGVTKIGAFSFEGLQVMTHLTVPASVSGMGDGAFGYACDLTNLLFLGNAPVAPTDAFSGNHCTGHALPTVYYLGGHHGLGCDTWGRSGDTAGSECRDGNRQRGERPCGRRNNR